MVASDVGIPFHLIRNSPSATTGNDWSIPTTPSVQPLFQDLLSTEEGGLENMVRFLHFFNCEPGRYDGCCVFSSS